MKTLVAFLSRNLWIYVILAFAILIGAWFTIISIAIKHAPQEIEVKKDAANLNHPDKP
jgi:hypothetical protein